ncbi:hypothetical protein C8A03DRAFT_36819 [Achaetomium macrosporum]|uniref:Calcineurin-like phosphoesterase domain-containing protein n=1 Tax=Achaetomium macrosporum TaxID=79813 RepID=A0AAN7H522_9PEZI|nr:hypothetical protein C8A03DRAFT_36819 [Achaetomium macrosporum]
MRSQIQLLSDLHLEVGKQYTTFTFPASAPLLLLAGDIGRLTDYDTYRSFLASQVARYRKVFLLLGNHEFYGLSYESGLETAQHLAEEPSLTDRLVLLHRARWDDPDSDLTILGCTLWPAIPEESCAIVEAKVNDFKMIDGWGQVAEATRSDPERRILIATHHAPCVEGISRPEHVNNPWAPAFATDLVAQGGWGGVEAWVFGHTQFSSRLSRKGVKLVSNQRGYVFPGNMVRKRQYIKAKGEHDFDASLTISL